LGEPGNKAVKIIGLLTMDWRLGILRKERSLLYLDSNEREQENGKLMGKAFSREPIVSLNP